MTDLAIATPLSTGFDVGPATADTADANPALAAAFLVMLMGQGAPATAATAAAGAAIKAPPATSKPMESLIPSGGDAPAADEDAGGDGTDAAVDPVLNLPIMGAPLLPPTIAPLPVASPVPVSTAVFAADPAPVPTATIPAGMAVREKPYPGTPPVMGGPIAIDGPIAPRAGLGGRRPTPSGGPSVPSLPQAILPQTLPGVPPTVGDEPRVVGGSPPAGVPVVRNLPGPPPSIGPADAGPKLPVPTPANGPLPTLDGDAAPEADVPATPIAIDAPYLPIRPLGRTPIPSPPEDAAPPPAPAPAPIAIAIDPPAAPGKPLDRPLIEAADAPDLVLVAQDVVLAPSPDPLPVPVDGPERPGASPPVEAADLPDLVLMAQDEPVAIDPRKSGIKPHGPPVQPLPDGSDAAPTVTAADAPRVSPRPPGRPPVTLAPPPAPTSDRPRPPQDGAATVALATAGAVERPSSESSTRAAPAPDEWVKVGSQAAPAPAPSSSSSSAPAAAVDATPPPPTAAPLPTIRAAAARPDRAAETNAVAGTETEIVRPRRATAAVADSRAPDIAAAPAPATAASATDPTAAATPATALADRAAAHRLDLAAGDRWLDQLARDIARTAGNDGQLRFQLNPEHLGSLHVEVRHTADGASVRLSADSEAARAILSDARPRLFAEAQAQGVRIADAQVGGGGGQSMRQGDGQRAQQPFAPNVPQREGAVKNIAAVTVNQPIGAMSDRYA